MNPFRWIMRRFRKRQVKKELPEYVDTGFGRARVFNIEDLLQEVTSVPHGTQVMVDEDTLLVVLKIKELQEDLKAQMLFRQVEKEMMS